MPWLYRTELGFIDRTEPPSVAEQVAAYRAVFSAFDARRVVVRTLDAGSDKPLPFLAYGQEVKSGPRRARLPDRRLLPQSPK